MVTIGAVLLGGGHLWLARNLIEDRLAGRGWDNPLHFALMLATLAGIALFFAAGAVLVWRARLDMREDGFVLRGLWRTREIPWTKVEGYRLRNLQMYAYLAEDELPLHLAHFERRNELYAWFLARVPDLHGVERSREASAIRGNLELGLTDGARAARLAALGRPVRALNRVAYAVAVLGGANALFFRHAMTEAAAAAVLIAIPVALMLYALRHLDHVRIGYPEGTAYPDALTGILAAGFALVLMSALDPHTLLGDRFYAWAVPLAAVYAALWMVVDRERVREHARGYSGIVLVGAILFFSGLWASGTVYQVNKHADRSAIAWGRSAIIALRATGSGAGRSFLVTVEPWSASPETVELEVRRKTWEALKVGAAVRIGVRRGALGIPWVVAVRPAR